VHSIRQVETTEKDESWDGSPTHIFFQNYNIILELSGKTLVKNPFFCYFK